MLDSQHALFSHWGVSQLVLEHLSKTFSVARGSAIEAVRDLNLTVNPGEFLVLLGPSASGKTTTLRLIAGLEEPTAGRILLDGTILNNVQPDRRDIAMVFQNSALFPHLTVAENIGLGLRLRRVPKAEIAKCVNEVAATIRVADCLERYPTALSAGQQQRVALARALVRRPKLFLFDEPLSNLDPHLRTEMRNEIGRSRRSLGITSIFVTHDQTDAMTLADRVAVIKSGQLQQIASPGELYRQPANVFVARFIGSPPMNICKVHLQRRGEALYCVGHSARAEEAFSLAVDAAHVKALAPYLGREVTLGLRPEAIVPTADGQAGENLIRAKVRQIMTLGFENHVCLSAAEHELVARVSTVQKLKPNEMVRLAVNMAEAQFFDMATENAVLLAGGG